MPKQTQHATSLAALKKASQDKRQNTLTHVKLIIDEMIANELPINFQSVATCAQVSKSWLYAQLEIVSQIKSLRIEKGKIKRLTDQQNKIAQKDQLILKLNQQIIQLKDENQQLKKQIELIYGKLCQAS